MVKCQSDNCKKRAYYNVKEEKPKYCGIHRNKTTMINVLKKTCKDDNCDIKPYFNYKGQKTRFIL